jgi:glycosyltransferase involved in cell wall biosynthesis
MSTQIKLLHVSPSYYPAIQFGGPIQSVHLLNKSLVSKGMHVDVITTNAGLESNTLYSSQDWLQLDGVRVKYFSYYGYVHYNFSIPLFRYLKSVVKDYDLVHITAVWNFPVWAASYACRRANIPYVLSPRGTIYPQTVALQSSFLKKLYYQLLAKKCLEQAKAIHYTATDEQEKVSQYLRLATPSFVIPNGVNFEAFASLEEIAPFFSYFPELRGKSYILFLSRIHIKKGLDLLVEAFAEVNKLFPEVVLVIAGPDNDGYGKEVKKQLIRKGILTNVLFTGMLSGDVKLSAYQNAELFVLPSYSENFGMSVVEAMACGTPVVISDQVGIAREIKHRQAGIVVPVQSSKVADAVITLLQNPAKRMEVGRNGLQMVKEYFDIDTVSENMASRYRHILSGETLARKSFQVPID